MRLLVVEHDDPIAGTLGNGLIRGGYEVIRVASGA
jgi:DNA-binding response OmpR family regulator